MSAGPAFHDTIDSGKFQRAIAPNYAIGRDDHAEMVAARRRDVAADLVSVLAKKRMPSAVNGTSPARIAHRAGRAHALHAERVRRLR